MENKRKSSFSLTLSHLKASTPKFFRRLGNALFLASLAVAGFSFIADFKQISGIVAVAGFVGKVLMEFFKDESVSETPTETPTENKE